MTREEAIGFAEFLKNNWIINFDDMEKFCDFCDKTDNEIAKKFRLFQLMLNDRWREQRKPKKYREDCFWYDEVQDMSAHIPVCNYREYPDCYIHECPEHCKTYLEREEAIKILREYAKGGKE